MKKTNFIFYEDVKDVEVEYFYGEDFTIQLRTWEEFQEERRQRIQAEWDVRKLRRELNKNNKCKLESSKVKI